MQKPASAVAACAAVFTAAALGARHGPQHPAAGLWYARLRKPFFTPPGPAVGAAWGILELLLAVAGNRLLQAPPGAARNTALAGWGMTLAGLAGYPWLFFGKRKLGPSALASGGMLAAASVTAIAARRADPPAAALTAPLLVWLGFATALSEELWRRNVRPGRKESSFL